MIGLVSSLLAFSRSLIGLAAAIQLEDLMTPKLLAPSEGPHAAPCEEHVAKIRAAVKARVDEDFLIVGRLDAIVDGGRDEAIERGRAYEDAGADVMFIQALPVTTSWKRSLAQRTFLKSWTTRA